MDRHSHSRFFRHRRRNRPFPFFRCDSSSGLLVSGRDAILKLGGCLKLFLGSLCLLFFLEALCFSECLHLYLGASRPFLGHDYFARVLIRVLSTSLDAGRIGSGRGHFDVWKSRDGERPKVELVPFFDPRQQQTQPRFSANLVRRQACSPAMRPPPFNNGRLIPCNHAGCGRFFQNRSGLTQHTRTSHKYSFSLPQPIRRVATPPLSFDLIDRSSSPPCVDENPEIDSFTDAESNADTTHDVDDNVDQDQPHEETRQPTVESHPFLTGLSVLCSPVPCRSCCTI